MIIHPSDSAGLRHSVRVYYEDTDAGGVVYYANYLRFAERARTEALRELGVSHADMGERHGVMFMVRRVKVDYFRSARLDESLAVVTVAQAIRAASVQLRQSFFREPDEPEAKPLVVVDVELACVRMADQRPARVPERWRSALQSLTGIPDKLDATVAGRT